MKAETKVIAEAAAMVRRTRRLKAALREWFDNKGESPDPGIAEFEDWVRRRLEDMASTFPAGLPVTAANLCNALKVNACGVPLAISLARKAAKAGYLTDTCCYVEDGIVYASVWLKGRKLHVNGMGHTIAAALRDGGYSADLWTEEEDEGEVTVNAQIGFAGYLERE